MTDTVRVPREPTPEMVRAGCAVTCVECFADCKSSDAAAIYRAMLAASPQEAVPTKREAALADLAKLDGETMDLAASPQGEGSSAEAEPVPKYELHHPTGSGGSSDVLTYRVTEGVKP